MGSIAALIYERALDHLDNHLVRVNAADVPAPYRAGQPSSCREDRRDGESDPRHLERVEHTAEQLGALAHVGDAAAGGTLRERSQVVVLRVGALLRFDVRVATVAARVSADAVVVDEHSSVAFRCRVLRERERY